MTGQVRQISFDYSKLETVIQGGEAVSSLVQQVDTRGARRVFLLISRTLHDNSEIVGQLDSALGGRLADVFSGVPAHTPRPAVLEAIERARRCETDLLVTIGGGSVIDAAKAVQLALQQGLQTEQQLLDYAQFADGSRGSKAGDFSLFTEPSTLRQIAIPTTLSGAEFSNNAGVTDPVKSLKEGYRGPDLCPQAIIYDPALGCRTPEWLWLSTAIRSLDHAIEGYCSADAHSYLEGHFLHAMRLFASSLPLTRSELENIEARSFSQQAVWLACCGLGQVRHGASHGIGYLLGAVCGVPHGYTSCVMLPAVLNWNSRVNNDRQQVIAEALGEPDLTAGQAVRQLVAALQLPQNLQDVGVSRDQLPQIARLASQHPVVQRNPRAIANADDVQEILELAWS
ncbi:MAG: iron-containing alcohol dehydrogenase [Gammaproteobacteria bacterium]|nr:iron-containing alcohol dehydrogenase [Gammaproteobacteria bacterium]